MSMTIEPLAFWLLLAVAVILVLRDAWEDQ